MKGVIFTEFIEFIEDNYTSIDMDHILDILDPTVHYGWSITVCHLL
jgi:hypothetical protein